jgi:hypothetical protein
MLPVNTRRSHVVVSKYKNCGPSEPIATAAAEFDPELGALPIDPTLPDPDPGADDDALEEAVSEELAFPFANSAASAAEARFSHVWSSL